MGGWIVDVDETIDSITNTAAVLVGDISDCREKTAEFYLGKYGFINLQMEHSEGPEREPSLEGCCIATRAWTLYISPKVLSRFLAFFNKQ